MRANFASLRLRLIMLTLVVLVPALGLFVYTANQTRKNALDEVKFHAFYLARLAASEESQIIQSTRQLLQLLAQSLPVRDAIAPAACNEIVARQIKLNPQYYSFGMLDPSGMLFCSALAPGQARDLSGRAFFRRAVETREFAVGDYQIGSASGKAGVSFGYPVLDAAGALRGVVYATLNLEWLGKSMARAQLPPQATLSVIDAGGRTLARFPDPEGLAGGAIAPAMLQQMLAQSGGGTAEGVGPNGIRSVWGFVPLHQSASGAMFVRVGMPVAAAYGGIDEAFYRNMLLIAVTTLLVVGVAWAGGELLVIRPVKKLTHAARRLSQGHLGARTGLRHGHDEFGQLARVFDHMADTIQSEDAEVERLMTQQSTDNVNLASGMGELEQLNREITQLSRMSQLLQACQNVDEACAAIAQAGRLLFPTEVAALFLMHASRSYLDYKAGWGEEGARDSAIAPESCWALRRGQTHCFEPHGDDLRCEHALAESPSAPTVCVPLVAQGDVLGLLHVQFPTPQTSQTSATIESRQQLATTFAMAAGLALASLKLREALKEQSIRDPLTGLYNRRFLEESLERELARAWRNKAPLALIMADVDHFKRFNDTYGHDAGDAVLRNVAQTLKSQVRASDIVCRFGGEEFTLILPDSALDAARDKAESLRRAIAALTLNHAGQTLPEVTMSFGLAMFPAQGADFAALLHAADLALYEAKNTGRNRVACAPTMAGNPS